MSEGTAVDQIKEIINDYNLTGVNDTAAPRIDSDANLDINLNRFACMLSDACMVTSASVLRNLLDEGLVSILVTLLVPHNHKHGGWESLMSTTDIFIKSRLEGVLRALHTFPIKKEHLVPTERFIKSYGHMHRNIFESEKSQDVAFSLKNYAKVHRIPPFILEKSPLLQTLLFLLHSGRGERDILVSLAKRIVGDFAKRLW